MSVSPNRVLPNEVERERINGETANNNLLNPNQ